MTDSVKSADRVMKILEFLANSSGGCVATGIARHLDIPMSSCVGLLATMRKNRFVDLQPGTKKYTLADKVRKIGATVDAHSPLEDMAIRCARQLNRQLGHPVAVSRRVGLFIEWAFTVGRTHLQPGATMPIFKSFNGLTAMSYVSEQQLAAIIDEYNTKFGRDLAINPRDVMKRVEAYRGRDYAAGGAPSYPGLGYICFRLADADTEEEVLLTVILQQNELSRREPVVVKAVRECVSYHSGPNHNLTYAS